MVKRIKELEKDLKEFKELLGSDVFLELKKDFNQKTLEKTILLLDCLRMNETEEDSTYMLIYALVNCICTLGLHKVEGDFKEFSKLIDIVIYQLKLSKDQENIHAIRGFNTKQ